MYSWWIRVIWEIWAQLLAKLSLMWFCDAKHVIALVIIDHWACFRDVPGEKFAEAVYFGEAARVCAARVHQVSSREHAQAQPHLRRWCTLSKVYRYNYIFSNKNYFYNYFKEMKGKCSGECNTAQTPFWKRSHLFRLAIPLFMPKLALG